MLPAYYKLFLDKSVNNVERIFEFRVNPEFETKETILGLFKHAHNSNNDGTNGVDPRWSSGLSRYVFRSWMRKVVSSNPGEDLYRNLIFLLWCRISIGIAIFEEQEEVQINLLRLVEPSNNIV